MTSTKRPKSVRPADLMGVAEVAEMAGLPRTTITVWKVRGKLPEPWAVLAMGPVWLRGDIAEWIASL